MVYYDSSRVVPQEWEGIKYSNMKFVFLFDKTLSEANRATERRPITAVGRFSFLVRNVGWPSSNEASLRKGIAGKLSPAQ
jgi:hypothetical protein